MTFLDDVLAVKRTEVAQLRKDPAPLSTAIAVPRFGPSLRQPGLSVIAEIKRRSPSKGDLARDLDVAEVAQSYAQGGASALSCLTDRDFFGAREGDFAAACAASLPVLRKDFLIDEVQIDESLRMGASAVLLIARILPHDRLEALLRHATSRGLEALVEVHDEAEVEGALRAGASIIGVNNRDLQTLRVDSGRAFRVRACIPSGVVSVAESGVKNRDDVRRIEDAGFDAVLIGEALVTSADPATTLMELRGCVAEAAR